MKSTARQGKNLVRLPVVICVFLAFIPPSSRAVEFEHGEVNGSFDTTLTYGQSYRTGGADRSITGLAPDFPGLSGSANAVAGSSFSENSDDGTQNYDQGLVSNLVKFTSELDLNYRNYGLFFRFNGFNDFESADAGDRTPLTNKADRLVTRNVNIQDLYLWSDFKLGKMPVTIRVGEQVLSWGESTFIQNGINVINPFDVSKLRTPGSEIRDALLPVGMVTASIAATVNLSFEAYYQYDYERTLVEPPGSFFSTNDFVGDGGRKVMLGFGDYSDRGTLFGTTPATAAAAAAFINGALGFAALDPSGFDADFQGVLREADNRPDEGGEFGVSLRYFAEELNNTEFGFYYIRHHSRTPVISAITGTPAGVASAFAAAGGAAAIGGGLVGFGGLTPAQAGALTPAIIADQYTRTANYFIEYPEDIDRVGLSFNTQLSGSGIALQGEYTFTHDAPLQVDDVELLLAALCPLAALNPAVLSNQIDPGCASTTTNQRISGFIERDVSQVQVTATKIFGPTFKADTAVLVGEIGVTHVHNMPGKNTLRLNGAGTFTSGNPIQTAAGGAHAGKAFESADHFADATSWGYRMAGRLTYNNVFNLVNVSPRFAWSHDVDGITPGPGGNFLEGRKAISLGVNVDYLSEWQADLSYTNFFGAGRHNLLNDRDFLAFNLKYSF